MYLITQLWWDELIRGGLAVHSVGLPVCGFYGNRRSSVKNKLFGVYN